MVRSRGYLNNIHIMDLLPIILIIFMADAFAVIIIWASRN